MKILKILGLVVGVHIAAFMFVFAIPGCRSTVRQSPGRSAEAAAPAPTVSYPGSASSTTSTLSPEPVAPLGAPMGGSDPSPVGAGENYGSTAVHFNPTRPGTPTAAALQTPAVTDVTPATSYTVASGDTLWKVAKKHGVTTKELAAANKLRSDATLRQGQKLIIPGKPTGTPQGVSSPSAVGASGASAETLTYKVRSGESLAQIAKRSGSSVATIKALNHLTSDTVRAGQELTLPAGGSSTTTLASTVEPERTAPASTTKAAVGSGTKYTVRPGESLAQIAKRFGVSLREIAAINHISDPQRLRAGQELVIPAGGSKGTVKNSSSTTAPAAAPATQPAPENNSPISAPSEQGQGPVIAPTPTDAPPPVVKVEDSGSPVAPAKNP